VRRLYAWLAGFAGGAAAYRAFRRRPPEPAAPEPDPADALKAKLAQAKQAESEPAESKQAQSKQAQSKQAGPGPAPVDVEGRRSSIHEQARAAIDEMNAGS
jgi:hypothetical protein